METIYYSEINNFNLFLEDGQLYADQGKFINDGYLQGNGELIPFSKYKFEKIDFQSDVTNVVWYKNDDMPSSCKYRGQIYHV